MLLSAKDVRATLKTRTSMDVWTKGLVGNVAESLESLERSLTRQSEKLAEALKEKNAAIETRNFKQIELDQRNAALSKLQKELDAAQDRVKSVLRASEERAQCLMQQRNDALRELAALRPPEPKFKIGQVLNVAYGSYALFPKHILVTRVEFHAQEKGFRYWHEAANGDEVFFREPSLRALTAQEKGE